MQWNLRVVLMVQRHPICQKMKTNIIYHVVTPLKQICVLKPLNSAFVIWKKKLNKMTYKRNIETRHKSDYTNLNPVLLFILLLLLLFNCLAYVWTRLLNIGHWHFCLASETQYQTWVVLRFLLGMRAKLYIHFNWSKWSQLGDHWNKTQKILKHMKPRCKNEEMSSRLWEVLLTNMQDKAVADEGVWGRSQHH